MGIHWGTAMGYLRTRVQANIIQYSHMDLHHAPLVQGNDETAPTYDFTGYQLYVWLYFLTRRRGEIVIGYKPAGGWKQAAGRRLRQLTQAEKDGIHAADMEFISRLCSEEMLRTMGS